MSLFIYPFRCSNFPLSPIAMETGFMRKTFNLFMWDEWARHLQNTAHYVRLNLMIGSWEGSCFQKIRAPDGMLATDTSNTLFRSFWNIVSNCLRITLGEVLDCLNSSRKIHVKSVILILTLANGKNFNFNTFPLLIYL